MDIKKHFCILPWIHLNVMPDSTVIPCCISPYDEIYGDGKSQTVMDVWNSEKFKELRLKMLNDLPNSGCSRCYQIEAAGFMSMRKKMNKQFASSIELTELTKPDGSLAQVQLKYIDIRFSNLCNFKCRGCSPSLSSSWHEDHQKLYSYQSQDSKIQSISSNSPNFLKELMSLVPYAEVVYFGGGEPLITREHYDVLKILISNHKFNIELRYDSNLSMLSYDGHNLLELWSKFKKVVIGMSIDDINERAEFFRSGTKWSQIVKNMIELRDNYPNIERLVYCTVSTYNVFFLPEIIEYLVNNQFVKVANFEINLLLDPAPFRIDVAPVKLKNAATKKLKRYQKLLFFKDPNSKTLINKIGKIINFMNQNIPNVETSNFIQLNEALDHIRSESFSKTYPEISNYFD